LLVFVALLVLVGPAEAKRIKRESLQSSLHTSFVRVQWRFFDKKYEIVPSERFVNEFLPYFDQYLRERGIQGVTAGFGAKQYAEVFKMQLSQWMRQDVHLSGQPACGIALTTPSLLSGRSDLPSAWLLVDLDGHWAVVHPVTLRTVWLKDFEHAGTISAIHF